MARLLEAVDATSSRTIVTKKLRIHKAKTAVGRLWTSVLTSAYYLDSAADSDRDTDDCSKREKRVQTV